MVFFIVSFCWCLDESFEFFHFCYILYDMALCIEYNHELGLQGVQFIGDNMIQLSLEFSD